ncbi:MAG: hypothetical protein FJX76_11230 [Armatimonadetes bacterium]|nr:hypothetical protein [Armatimonadota bacterium]
MECRPLGVSPALPLVRRSASPPTAGDGFAPSLEDPEAASIERLRAASKQAPLDGIEFKMLLVPERFADDEDAAAAAFWKKVEKASKDAGITELEPEHAGERNRTVTFLDTDDFALFDRGLLLRRREEDGEPPELTLKVRGPRREVIDATDTSAAPEFDGETRVERDVTCGRDTLQGRWAKSTRVRLEDEAAPASVFPLLDASARLSPVNDLHIDERAVKMGRVRLSKGVKADASMSYWRDWANAPTPGLVEFSFRYDVDKDATPEDVEKAERNAERVLLALRREASGWVAEGGTKTEYVYRRNER